MKTYLAVWLSLMILLALTVLAAKMHLGTFAALAVAVAKSGLVVVFFMHLRAETRRTQFVALAVLFWLSLLFGITMLDYYSRL